MNPKKLIPLVALGALVAVGLLAGSVIMLSRLKSAVNVRQQQATTEAKEQKDKPEPAPKKDKTVAVAVAPEWIVSATSYYGIWHENELEAKTRYNGKGVRLIGPIKNVTTVGSEVHVHLYTDEIEVAEVIAKFKKKDSSELGSLRHGIIVVIDGVGDGKGLLGSPYLKDCRLRSSEYAVGVRGKDYEQAVKDWRGKD